MENFACSLAENCEDDEKLFNDGECVNRKWFGIYINDDFREKKKVIKFGDFMVIH